MDEHKKMYKAGKRWLVASLALASVTVGSALASEQPAVHAATAGDTAQQVTAAGIADQPTPAPTPNSTKQDDSLVNITDGNITISGPDQNQGQRDQLNQQLDQAKQATAQAQATYQELADQSSSYQNAVNAKRNYDAAYKKVGQIQYYDLVGHQLPERRASLNKQADQLDKRAQEQE